MLNKPFLSIQEMVEKTVEQRKRIELALDSKAAWHPEDASILDGLGAEDRYMMQQSLNQIPLAEFLAKSGTTGIAGAAYLVANAVHTKLVNYAEQTDLCPRIGTVVNGWDGANLLVDIASRHTYVPQRFSSGANAFVSTVETMQATITPVGFNMAVAAGMDLLDDSAFELLDWHVEQAAKAMGRYASNLALIVLAAAADGWGTLNSGLTGDADETRLVNGTTNDIVGCIRDVGNDLWVVDTMVTTPEAWGHSISTQAAEVGWSISAPKAGYDFKLGNLDVILSTDTSLHAATDALGAAFTNCVTLLFSKENSLLTGRKRWLELKNYGDPVRDLAGAVVSARQDSVTLYDDSVYTLTET